MDSWTQGLLEWVHLFKPLYRLNYPSDDFTHRYALGPQDLITVLGFVVGFTGLRALLLSKVLSKMARLCGVRKNRAQKRFAEQGYLLLYYSVYWTWGVYILARDTSDTLPPGQSLSIASFSASLWTHYPRLVIDGHMKLYYLSQLAFWLQQLVVIHLEERRKDHYQMLLHHVISVTLLFTSYGNRQFRPGNMVMVCMDVGDLLLSAAKILRYMGRQSACDAAFTVFTLTWIVTRHIVFLAICHSLNLHFGGDTFPFGIYSLTLPPRQGPAEIISGRKMDDDGGHDIWRHLTQPFFYPNAETVANNPRIKTIFLGLMLALQSLLVLWFALICRVIVNVLSGHGADDNRSDAEDEDDAGEKISEKK
ncbi:hypothetical protein PRZ48_005705 [Zasmidium cellare]|uniref:TLC domain-containing protein n=1 Tax=Zasmidium cellare TaxID=395010 RepID=A0ABR0EL97_ZASCE|nr:hypothetical protein PRZ48_005705 [Zasmidium cellare]